MSLGPRCTSDLRVREYNPEGAPRSKHIRPEEWRRHETRIRTLHGKRFDGRKYTHVEMLAELRADCGCRPHCSFNPSPSQYAAQLKVLGLRTYRTEGAGSTSSNRREPGTLPQSPTETPRSTLAGEAYREPDIISGLGVPSFPQHPTLSPRPISVLFRPIPESLDGNGVNDDQQPVGMEAGRLGSPLSNEASPLTEEVESRVHSKRSPPPPHGSDSPWSAGEVYSCFTASGTVKDGVGRVIRVLSSVLSDSELEQFLGNLTDIELDELLTNHVKLDEALNDALATHSGKLLRLGLAFGPHSTRLVEIRDALEERARALYSPTSHTDCVHRDQCRKVPTASSFEQSPATEDRDSIEESAVVRIYDDDTELPHDIEVLGFINHVHDSKDSIKMPSNELGSCSACANMPSAEYKVSDDALRLWSEVSSGQDRFNARDEMRILAGYLFAARAYADAFDLYHIIWTEFGSSLSEFEMLAAATDCARTAATPSQDSRVEVILHHILAAYPSDLSLSRSSHRQLLAIILHSFLGDLYENLKVEKNAEAHGNKAMVHLDERKLHILQTSFRDPFSNHPHMISALESQIARRQKKISQAIGYSALTIPNHDMSKSFAAELQKSGLLEDLLTWSVKTIHENARGLDAFGSVLPKQLLEQRGFIWRTLLCYFVERWLNERRGGGSGDESITSKLLTAFAGLVSPSEALSAIAMLIVDDCPDQHKPFYPVGRQPPVGTLSSALLKNIKNLNKLKSIYRGFSEVYLSLMAPSGDVRRQQMDDKSREMMRWLIMNIAATSLFNRNLPPRRRVGSHDNLVPSPDLFREFEIRRASLSNLLYSPRSSFSSGLNSIRATATRVMTNSVLSLAKRQSRSSATAMSTTTDRSSWSFGGTTGMPSGSSVYSCGDVMDHDAGAVQDEHQDEEMVDA